MKKTVSIFISALIIALSVTAMAASKTTYTFKGNNVITDGSPNDITDVPLTDNITVTTSGDMNRKYAAITDLKHNNEVGTFPANDKLKATGSYIYLACANANDNAIITLNVPAIAAGSKVTLTFAKPTVTNNGSTLRNTNDPYAYLKIADRYISINGDNFDTWRTESVVTGKDTNAIEFHADKWGAVAISRIEISDGDGKPLHNLNISSTQYANLTVNGIKFCADENGQITLTSYPENEFVTIKAEKDGYAPAETSTTIGNADANVDIPLTCETDAAYYESDFGNKEGVLNLDGEYKFGDGVNAEEVTRVFGRVTFEDGGYLDINTDRGVAGHISCTDGVMYLNGEEITRKNNMEFEFFIDRKNNAVFLKQNEIYDTISDADASVSVITSISGKGAAVEYIGVSYPDTTKLIIEGPGQIPSFKDYKYTASYTAVPEYRLPSGGVDYSCETDFAHVDTPYKGKTSVPLFQAEFNLVADEGAEGEITLKAAYNGATAEKTVKIAPNPKAAEYTDGRNKKYTESGAKQTINLHANGAIRVYDVKDEYGNILNEAYGLEFKDFKSSDESVIKIDDAGYFAAVGKGNATVTFNAYTGADNIISIDYTVDQYWAEGPPPESDGKAYILDEFTDNGHITGYRLSWQTGSRDIEKTQIPAAEIKEDGTAVTAYYYGGELREVRSKKVKKGDKVLPSSENKRTYFCKAGTIEEITEADTTAEGFEISGTDGFLCQLAPIYTYDNIGDCAEGVTLDGSFDEGWYDFTFKKGETKRGDIYVNGFMAGNNVDQADADRKLTEGSEYTVEGLYLGNDGKITVSMTDGSTLLDSVSFTRTGYEFKPDIFIIGDSLVCNYYGDFEKEVGGGRTGWGQLLGNYMNARIVNLANSGQFAKGLYETAFPSVINSRPKYCLMECGYNDRSYSTREEMTACVKDMIKQCRENNITPILVTPNASQHDYKPSVVWSGYLRDIAEDERCQLIDLSQLSYDFLYSVYGDNSDGVVAKNYNLTEVGGDSLHSSYAAAQKWASIVAQELKNMWNNDEIFNTDYAYTFTDTLGNKITCKVE